MYEVAQNLTILLVIGLCALQQRVIARLEDNRNTLDLRVAVLEHELQAREDLADDLD